MGLEKGDLIFERASSNEALSSFSCGVREIDYLIHQNKGGLNDFMQDNNYESFIVYYMESPVAVFVYRNVEFETQDGNLDSIEIEFIAVRKDCRNKGVGTIIIQKISEIALLNNCHILKVGAFFNKKYSAKGFYEKCHFEQYSRQTANIIPMFKELI